MLLLLSILTVFWADLGDSNGGKCSPLFPRDLQSTSVPLPAIIQFEQSIPRSWKSYWEVVTKDETPLACVEVTGDEAETTVRSGVSRCDGGSGWQQTALYPAFTPGEGKWHNMFSIFVTIADGSFSIDLNRRPNYALIQHLDQDFQNFSIANQSLDQQMNPSFKRRVASVAWGIRRINMTFGGPKVQFPGVGKHGQCLGTKECYRGWTYLSLQPSDTIVLAHTHGEDTVEVKVTLSACFPDYLVGVHISKSTIHTISMLEVRYKREGRYHTLSATLSGFHAIGNTLGRSRNNGTFGGSDNFITGGTDTLFSSTVEHGGLDCAGQWFLLGVKGAEVFPNCCSRSHHHPVTLISASPATNVMQLTSLCIFFMLRTFIWKYLTK